MLKCGERLTCWRRKQRSPSGSFRAGPLLCQGMWAHGGAGMGPVGNVALWKRESEIDGRF